MKVLIFHIGSLGDTLASTPAMWAVREHFPTSHITLLSDRQIGQQYVTPRDVLDGSHIVDAFAEYRVGGYSVRGFRGGRFLNPVRKLSLLAWLRLQRFDAVAYLVHLHSGDSSRRVARDRRFFRLAGIKSLLGMDGVYAWPSKSSDQPLPTIPPMAEQLLARLRASGVDAPENRMRTDIGINQRDIEKMTVWLDALGDDGGRPWIAVAPGTKMTSKKWPAERFVETVNRLIAEFDVWPVVFGGGEDQSLAAEMIQQWRRGHVAAGFLGIRPAAAALERCLVYLGNDTGTMHLAASVGVPCAAVFSARDVPGAWNPLGAHHHVLRSQIECEGCMLMDCVERRNECLTRIRIEEVQDACGLVLRARMATLANPHFSP